MTEHSPNADDLKHKQTRQSTQPPKGFQRFAPFSIRHSSDNWQVQIYWKFLVAWILIVFVTGWITMASGAYVFVKYKRGFSEVKFADMLLLPLRWDAYQVSRGNFLIETAQKDLKQQKFREAF